MMSRSLIIVLETLLLLLLSQARGNNHVRAISKPRGAAAGGAIMRVLSSTHVKGERRLSMRGGSTQEGEDAEGGTEIIIFPITTEPPLRRNDFVEFEEPSRDYYEQAKLEESMGSTRSKLQKKKKKDRSKPKLKGPGSGKVFVGVGVGRLPSTRLFLNRMAFD
jgi:hypothetical protein